MEYLVHSVIEPGLKKINNGKQLISAVFLSLVKVIPVFFVCILSSQQELTLEYGKDTNQKRLKTILYRSI